MKLFVNPSCIWCSYIVIHASIITFDVVGISHHSDIKSEHIRKSKDHQIPKLLVIVLNGFRWDYLHIYSLKRRVSFRGFSHFQERGVSPTYLQSVFPSEPFSTWRTIMTGLHPDAHGIWGSKFARYRSATGVRTSERDYDSTSDSQTGPFLHVGRDVAVVVEDGGRSGQESLFEKLNDEYSLFYNQQRQKSGNWGENNAKRTSGVDIFDSGNITTTRLEDWWSGGGGGGEPLWVTAHKQKKKIATILWSRCDIPWYDDSNTFGPADPPITPDKCESVYERDSSRTLLVNLNLALVHFQQGYDASFIYESSVGDAGKRYGPISDETEKAIVEVDNALQNLYKQLVNSNMIEMVNVVIMSDHGMTRRHLGSSSTEQQTKSSSFFHISDHNNKPLVGKSTTQIFNIRDVLGGKAFIKQKIERITLSKGGAYAIIHPKGSLVQTSHSSAQFYATKRKMQSIVQKIRKFVVKNGREAYSPNRTFSSPNKTSSRVYIHTADDVPEYLHYSIPLTGRMEKLSVNDDFPPYNFESISKGEQFTRDYSKRNLILILARNGTILTAADSDEMIASGEGGEMRMLGLSGYDPSEQDMRGIFIGAGPDFVNDGQLTDMPLHLVDTYFMFCQLLRINCDQTVNHKNKHRDDLNARFKVYRRMLKTSSYTSTASQRTSRFVGASRTYILMTISFIMLLLLQFFYCN